MILFALGAFVLVGFVALSIDTGFLMSERRQVQNAADAAALAAASSVQASMASGDVTAAAVEYASANAGVTAADVTVDWPPPAGAPYAGDTNYVQVTVTKDVDRFFVGAVYNGPWQVTATATAGIEPEGFDAAILALNSNAGGIDTSGSTNITAVCGSIVSNYHIKTSGSTTISAQGGAGCPSPLSAYVVANDGFVTSGSTNINGASGVRPNGAEIPDPLLDKISPPTMPSVPGNPVSTVSPSAGLCRTYSPWTNPVTYTITSSGYFGGGSSCVNIQNIPSSETMRLQYGQYRFTNAGINIGGGNGGSIVLMGGTYNFHGNSSGIRVGGSTPSFVMESGNYSFTGGASINISGSANGNVIGGGNLYFSGGGAIYTGGSNDVTLGPGTYIFDGGQGIRMSGSSSLHFTAGYYEMYFANGADLAFSGSSVITFDQGAYVKAYFLGGDPPSWSDLEMSGSTSFKLPPGEYYFSKGRFLHSGSTLISGDSVFFYFRDGGYLSASGSATFGFTAPTTEIYPGYCCGVFIYSDRSNTAQFNWTGSTSSVSRGTIYLPKSPVKTAGSASGTSFEGQFIADRFTTSGSTGITVRFEEYVQTQIPKIFLVN